MKNFCRHFWIIAIITIIELSMIACDDGSGNNDGNDTINVGQLPEFPSGTTPAKTKADAETILAELRKSPILDSILNETWEIVDENEPTSENYSFSNRFLPNGFIKVSGSVSENVLNTGGFKKLEEGEEESNIQFAKGDKYNFTWNQYYKGELTKAITENGVTIVKGSTFEWKWTDGENGIVSTAGAYHNFRTNYTGFNKEEIFYAFTVATSSGSVKIIFDSKAEAGGTGNNVKHYWDEDDTVGTWTEIENFSGSLKVYGNNNALLIDNTIVDWESNNMASFMISYDPYSLNPAEATPLANNVKVDGTDLNSSFALYSIDVTSGNKYHLWWDDLDANSYSSDFIRVRGYYSDGNIFFDLGGNYCYHPESYYSFTAISTGKVYIMVYPNFYSTGTYAIVYNTTGDQPDM